VLEPTINDRINEILDDPTDVALNGWPYVEALRGVLREHRSIEVAVSYDIRGIGCKACRSGNGMPVWPCATVQAIADAFGLGGA
jgi:hypothetical protein